MQVLLVCLALFFVASELYQWVQGMTLPLPMRIMAGVALAIASNFRSLSVLPWNANSLQGSAVALAVSEPVAHKPVAPKPVELKLVEPELVMPNAPSVQLPHFISQAQPVSAVTAKSTVAKSGKGKQGKGKLGDRHTKHSEV